MCAALTRTAFCAPAFTLEAGVSLSSVTLRCLMPVSGGYRMYFSTAPAYAVFSATSSDGLAWSVEPGIRLSTGLSDYDASSITAIGVYADPALANGPYRAYYVGISTDGLYSILSATSTDGLAWGRDSGFLLRFNGGQRRVLSLAPYYLGAGKAMLYYVRDNGGTLDPSTFRVYAATSSDAGDTFSGETQVLASTGTFHIAVSSLTSGAIRLFATGTLPGGTTSAQVISADSADGALFGTTTQVFSTNPAANVLGAISVTRSTNTYGWRLHMNLRLGTSTTDYVLSAVTLSPSIYSFSPSSVYTDDPVTDFTLTGEIFSATPTVSITKGADVIASSVTRISDMQLTVRANPAGAALGDYSVTVTNPEGGSVTLAGALKVDYKPGFVVMKDNLFRPLKGGKARIDINIFYPGNITVKIYDLNGGLVRMLYDGPASASPPAKTVFWDGRTDSGGTAASGLYLLHLKGPHLDVKEKIVLIK